MFQQQLKYLKGWCLLLFLIASIGFMVVTAWIVWVVASFIFKVFLLYCILSCMLMSHLMKLTVLRKV